MKCTERTVLVDRCCRPTEIQIHLQKVSCCCYSHFQSLSRPHCTTFCLVAQLSAEAFCSRCGLNTIPWPISDTRPHITRSDLRDVTREWRDPSSPSCPRADLWQKQQHKKTRKKENGSWNFHVCKLSLRPWVLSCKHFTHTNHSSQGRILSLTYSAWLWDRYLQTHSMHDRMILSASSVVPIGCRKP